ncbi:MAG: membrane protein insertion efficiency factor YidD [Actinobacteria bacterium]|nr:membrane protein insertion efficiency factor YidD [Actinomycetota bacterium]NBO79722.1 membrane protein insertion efficiency factor YidD [Actinomycetota bacterium]NBR76312.1 membrane protein insertion efficiency factor YidD [Actinomycetota bacterium]NBR92582.1 membrane protein insertion efficiency factor YidD [Actinomycetota bacterium]NBT21019.1 membrane protein insertion efficiency factor YidD [Actinomycetota bacterium]
MCQEPRGNTVTRVTTPVSAVHRLGKAQQAMLSAIRWYQAQRTGALSPCRFFPSCSEYAHDAIATHGAWHGGLLAARRLSRCRPFGPSGFDPVPEHVGGEVGAASNVGAHGDHDGCCAHGTPVHKEQLTNV